MAIVYDGFEKGEGDKTPSLSIDQSRPNGSLYARQKRSIADACEWMRLHQTQDQRAIIFVLTSPGFTSLANTPKFISRFVENMRTNYGMGEYVWVREMTKKGFPHFHFVALWHNADWFRKKSTIVNCSGVTIPDPNRSEPMITIISRYWSKQFGSDSINSVRLGTYHKKKRTGFYLTDERHAWYLTKYLGKSIGDGSMDYLAEAGFPSVKYKKTIRSFAISYNLGLFSAPTLFDSCYLTVDRSIAPTVSGDSVEVQRTQRVWVSEDGQLIDDDVQAYDWRWTGHGETYIGIDKKRTRKFSLTSERGQ